MEEEIWKDIIGYEGIYKISNTGKIKNKYGFILANRMKSTKYYGLILYKNNKIKNVYVHRLIAIHFIPNPENKKCVNHINGIKSDYRIENLEWCTYKENSEHAKKNNLLKPATEFQLPQTKISNKQVFEIRKRLSNGEMGRSLSKEYGVSEQTICDIKKFRTRKL